MNLVEFKKYALENFRRTSIEISSKALRQRNTNSERDFDQEMERNINATEARINKMLDGLTEESFEAKKSKLVKGLDAYAIKNKCHTEVYNKLHR